MPPTLEIVPADAGPDLNTMQRADMPAIWQGYQADADSLIATARTIVVTDVSQKAQMKLAEETRKQVKKLRCEIENKRKELVAGYKKAAGEIDDAARVFKLKLEVVEEHLLLQSRFAEIEEAKQKAALKADRAAYLLPLGADPDMYQLAEMSEEQFTELFDALEYAHFTRQQAAQKAEAERLVKEKADAEERERIRLENEKLRAEARDRESALVAERAEAEKRRLEMEATVRRQRESMEAQARQERQAREKAEAELHAKAKADEAETRAKAAADRKAASAPDKTKLLALAAAITATPLPEMATEDGRGAMQSISAEIARLGHLIATKANAL